MFRCGIGSFYIGSVYRSRLSGLRVLPQPAPLSFEYPQMRSFVGQEDSSYSNKLEPVRTPGIWFTWRQLDLHVAEFLTHKFSLTVNTEKLWCPCTRSGWSIFLGKIWLRETFPTQFTNPPIHSSTHLPTERGYRPDLVSSNAKFGVSTEYFVRRIVLLLEKSGPLTHLDLGLGAWRTVSGFRTCAIATI